jgi:hypothetical protein
MAKVVPGYPHHIIQRRVASLRAIEDKLGWHGQSDSLPVSCWDNTGVMKISTKWA